MNFPKRKANVEEVSVCSVHVPYRMYGYNVDRAVFFFTSHPAQLVSIDMLLMDLSVRTLHPRTIPDSPRYSVNYGFEDHMCAPKRRRSQELKKRSGQNKNTMC